MVAGLVFVAAYAPGIGESANDNSSPYRTTDGQKQIDADPEGWALLTWEGIHKYVAEGLSEAEQRMMLATQALTYGPIFAEKLTRAAWKNRPTAHVVSTKDQTLPVDMQEADAVKASSRVTRVPACHMLPQEFPADVADAISSFARTIAA